MFSHVLCSGAIGLFEHYFKCELFDHLQFDHQYFAKPQQYHAKEVGDVGEGAASLCVF